MRIAKRGYVIATGQTILENDAKMLLANEQVNEAYLA